jgi:oligopeptide transport system substrate-binding protein
MLYGKLLTIERPEALSLDTDSGGEASQNKRKWIYTVEIDGVARRFSQQPPINDAVEKCRHVLLDFDQVGIRVLDPYRLEVELNSPTPYFLYLMQFYVTVPVNRSCIEQHGYPDWIRPENIVVNGPFQIDFRRLRDRVRLKKNEHYWDASSVQLQTVDALAVESSTTGLNMYLDGDVDWMPSPPSEVIPQLEGRRDYHSMSSLSIYFYRLNVTRKPFDDPLVRMALSRAVDRERICKSILRAGQEPAYSLVPPVLPHYSAAQAPEYNLEAARRLLAQAGYPGGRGLRSIEILFNTSDGHRKIAEAIQQDWQRLGIDVRLRNLEWQTYLSTTRKMDYDVARAGWIGDYPDPNTFLDLFVTDGVQNETGWGNREFDQLIENATRESNPEKRMQILHRAEEIIMGELPVMPLYFYVSTNLVKPYVRGFFSNSQDLHPLISISIDQAARKRDRQRKDGT